jgi:hypothetical protein
MRKDLRNYGNGAGGIIGHLASEKKKGILAVCLLLLMAFMWTKVFTGKSPKTTKAEQAANPVKSDEPKNQDALVTYLDLPEVEGRNDVITRDAFASNGWKDFVNKDKNVVTREVNVVPGDSTEKIIGKIAENLKLEAFVMGSSPRAYINEKILSVGDKLLVSDGIDNYECEVIMIENNSVIVRCGKAEVTLKLKKIMENN